MRKLVRPVEVEKKIEEERVKRIINKLTQSGQLKKRKRVFSYNGSVPINNQRPYKIKKTKKIKKILRINPVGFYETREWLSLRYQVLKKYGRRCMVCFATETIIQVDHIKPISKFPELALDESNLQVMCMACNLGKSNTDSIDWRPGVS